MPALEYQTFPIENRVFVGADATITTAHKNHNHPHVIDIRDRDRNRVVELWLTTEALVVLRDRINTVLDDPAEVAAWAARDLAGLALRKAMVVS